MKDLKQLENLIRGFFGMIFGILLGTVILSEGFWGGAIFYLVAIISAIMFVVSMLNLKGNKNEQR